MTATNILTRWQAVEPVLHDCRSWFVLLHIVAAGSAGISRYELSRLPGGRYIHTRTLHKWRYAGLVTITEQHTGGRPAQILHATPKVLQLLRLDHHAE